MLIALCQGLSITIPAHRYQWNREKWQQIRLRKTCQPERGCLALRRIHDACTGGIIATPSQVRLKEKELPSTAQQLLGQTSFMTALPL